MRVRAASQPASVARVEIPATTTRSPHSAPVTTASSAAASRSVARNAPSASVIRSREPWSGKSGTITACARACSNGASASYCGGLLVSPCSSTTAVGATSSPSHQRVECAILASARSRARRPAATTSALHARDAAQDDALDPAQRAGVPRIVAHERIDQDHLQSRQLRAEHVGKQLIADDDDFFRRELEDLHRAAKAVGQRLACARDARHAEVLGHLRRPRRAVVGENGHRKARVVRAPHPRRVLFERCERSEADERVVEIADRPANAARAQLDRIDLRDARRILGRSKKTEHQCIERTRASGTNTVTPPLMIVNSAGRRVRSSLSPNTRWCRPWTDRTTKRLPRTAVTSGDCRKRRNATAASSPTVCQKPCTSIEYNQSSPSSRLASGFSTTPPKR